MTARYPAMLAIELSTSSDCAREIRGTASMARTVIRRAASLATRSGSMAGLTRLARIAPSRRRAISSSDGALIFSTRSLAHTSSWEATRAPASS